MRTQILIFFCLVNLVIYSQVPYTHISSSTFNAERVASFGVVDVSTDFLEITNSTQFDNSFIPSIWAHQETDTRFVLRHFATTTSSQDDGDIPIMIFRTEIRNNLNYIAPIGGSFPWGTTASNILYRPLFAWENGNTQLMRILANGNVGINTTTPTALLHTVGSLRFQNLIDASSPFRLLGVDSNGNVYRYSPSDFGGGSVSDFDWLKPDGTTPSSINDNIYTNGFVGINVSNPVANLHTNGTLRFENIAENTNPFRVLGTDEQGNVFEYSPLEFTTTPISDFDWLKPDGTTPSSISDNIYTNGFVGINVSNPVANLHTNGTLRFENIAENTNPFRVLGTDSLGNVFKYNPSEFSGNSTSDFDWLKPDGTIPTSINDNIYTNGKVAINTNVFPSQVGNVNVSSYSLFVTGGILTEEVRVALVGDWADFVFEDGYPLESLEKVEEHIKEKKHLKGVPSEKEVKEDGIELVEMNKILLMKVEELTLYVIELNKRLNAQQEEIKQLKDIKK